MGKKIVITGGLGYGGMRSMFRNASAFNQNLSTWCVTAIGSEPSSFKVNDSYIAII